ncbi:MAG: glyoxalase [Actinobacteria bacterium]|nr:MAG: glyoxalase [Actinomycetota bacterium]
MSNPVVHFEVVGKDGSKLQKFYGDLFGWKISTDNPMNYGIVDNGGEGINGGVGEAPEGGSGHVTFYIQVPDINQHLGTIEQAGGRTVLPHTETDMVTFALFADPEGNVVGLVEGY